MTCSHPERTVCKPKRSSDGSAQLVLGGDHGSRSVGLILTLCSPKRAQRGGCSPTFLKSAYLVARRRRHFWLFFSRFFVDFQCQNAVFLVT